VLLRLVDESGEAVKLPDSECVDAEVVAKIYRQE
jgi:hypothetical protein